MRRVPSTTLGLATVAFGMLGLANVAGAQTPPPQYLRWAGRPDTVAMPVVTSDATATPTPRRPNRVIPHGGIAEGSAAPTPATHRTLTPANAWLRSAPRRPDVATPIPPSADDTATAHAASPPPAYLPEQGGRGQAVPANIALAAAQPPARTASGVVPSNISDDPMAPRPDAPVFRVQAAAANAPARAEEPLTAPGEQSARYYSVHRPSGRTPDPIAIPEPGYVDGLAVTAPVTIASQDLAEPQPGPTLIRDTQGRTRVQPAAPEGDFQ
ncbi:hypothetical protein [Brevundimonas sp. FT23042]|uniref:hypothetical protein n=1 Tax=Brevundimonas sp. FT23042 TaxID=3393749 RepID=UPI003B58A785